MLCSNLFNFLPPCLEALFFQLISNPELHIHGFELLFPSPPLSVPLLPLIHAIHSIWAPQTWLACWEHNKAPNKCRGTVFTANSQVSMHLSILNLSNWAASSRPTWWFCLILCADITIWRKTDGNCVVMEENQGNCSAMKSSTSAPSAGFMLALRAHRKSSET